MLSSFTDWLHQPFNQNMTAARWFAWVGLMLAFLMIWGLIIHRVQQA